MAAPPMSSERRRELADLRSRAYGPGADIHLDTDALARLIELEEEARADAEAVTPASAPAGAESAEQPTAGTARATVDVAEQVPMEGAGVRERWWRRIPSWALVAGAVAIGLTAGLIGPAVMAPRPDAVLRSVPIDEYEVDFEMYGVVAEDPVRYETFHELELWSAVTETGSECLLVTTGAGEWMAAGCAPEPQNPIAQIDFFPGMRPIDGLELPPGSVARFELRDGQVEVWIATTTEQT